MRRSANNAASAPDEFLDQHIGLIAAEAFRDARNDAIARGLTLVEQQGEWLVRRDPDGTITQLRKLAARVRVELRDGQLVRIA